MYLEAPSKSPLFSGFLGGCWIPFLWPGGTAATAISSQTRCPERLRLLHQTRGGGGGGRELLKSLNRTLEGISCASSLLSTGQAFPADHYPPSARACSKPHRHVLPDVAAQNPGAPRVSLQEAPDVIHFPVDHQPELSLRILRLRAQLDVLPGEEARARRWPEGNFRGVLLRRHLRGRRLEPGLCLFYQPQALPR